MRVFELMAAMASMPSNATVVVDRLADKSELDKCADDPRLTRLNFTIRECREDPPDYSGGPSKVILDGWAE